MKKVLIAYIMTHLLCFHAYAISHGEKVSDTEFRSVVGLPDCTGVFIHPQIILTAAHCNFMDSRNYIEVNFVSRHSTEALDVKQIKPKELYRRTNPPHLDIAYVLLKKPIQDRNIIEAIPEVTSLESGQRLPLIAVGMGTVASLRKTDNELTNAKNKFKRKLPMSILSVSMEGQYGEAGVVRMISEVESGGLCNGDSGGAAFAFDGLKYKLVSLLNYIANRRGESLFQCGEPDSMAGGVLVAPHLCWVQQSTGIDLGLKNCNSL